jgi:hypothetical protein
VARGVQEGRGREGQGGRDDTQRHNGTGDRGGGCGGRAQCRQGDSGGDVVVVWFAVPCNGLSERSVFAHPTLNQARHLADLEGEEEEEEEEIEEEVEEEEEEEE